MDVDRQRELDQLLSQTLEDERLSKSETRSLRALAEDLAHDVEARGYLRNRAFALARERAGEDAAAVLTWLQRVDRILDRADPAAGGKPPSNRVAFSPGDACLGLVLETIRGARRRLDVCVFTITDDRISETLLRLHRRGVALRILTDDEKAEDPGSDVDRLAEAGIPVRRDRTPDHMHHKFAVVDDEILLNGSFNWTRSAGQNHENVHVTDDPAVVAPYREAFARLWSDLA